MKWRADEPFLGLSHTHSGKPYDPPASEQGWLNKQHKQTNKKSTQMVQWENTRRVHEVQKSLKKHIPLPLPSPQPSVAKACNLYRTFKLSKMTYLNQRLANNSAMQLKVDT